MASFDLRSLPVAIFRPSRIVIAQVSWLDPHLDLLPQGRTQVLIVKAKVLSFTGHLLYVDIWGL